MDNGLKSISKKHSYFYPPALTRRFYETIRCLVRRFKIETKYRLGCSFKLYFDQLFDNIYWLWIKIIGVVKTLCLPTNVFINVCGKLVDFNGFLIYWMLINDKLWKVPSMSFKPDYNWTSTVHNSMQYNLFWSWYFQFSWIFILAIFLQLTSNEKSIW